VPLLHAVHHAGHASVSLRARALESCTALYVCGLSTHSVPHACLLSLLFSPPFRLLHIVC
jgi:hypothetical protein